MPEPVLCSARAGQFNLRASKVDGARGHIEPWLAMWLPNIVLTVLGLIGLIRVSRESGSTRGGDFQEVVDGVRHLFRGLRRARLPLGRRA